MLYEIGPLESWDLADDHQNPRLTAKATFMDESHAGDASLSLNESSLPFFEEGKLSMQPAVSLKLKVLCRVYDTVQEEVGAMVAAWRVNGVTYTAYPPQGSHRTLRLKGASRSGVTKPSSSFSLPFADM